MRPALSLETVCGTQHDELGPEWWLFGAKVPEPQHGDPIDYGGEYGEAELVALEGRKAAVAIRIGKIATVLGVREGDRVYATLKRRIVR